jgi:hypothetical protein
LTASCWASEPSLPPQGWSVRSLVAVSDWGAGDNTGRHQVSYAIDAFLRATPNDLQGGFTIDKLRAAVDQEAKKWCASAGCEPVLMTAAESAKKLKVDWMKHQIQKHNTPVVVYDRIRDRVFVNDSAVVFVHRTKAFPLLKEFHDLLRKRAAD